MVEALRRAEIASGKKVAYIGGIDLCHVGPEFGDPSPVDDATLGRIRSFDDCHAPSSDRAATPTAGSGRRPRSTTAGGSAASPQPILCCTRSARRAAVSSATIRPSTRPGPAVSPLPASPSSGPSERLHLPPMSETSTTGKPCDFRAEVVEYDRLALVRTWSGPRHLMTFRTLGEGPALVLLPGLASTYRGYAPILLRLARRFRTIQLDYPGENPDDQADLNRIGHDNLVDDQFGLLDHLEVAGAFPFGLSFGSTITLKALQVDPKRFPKAVLQGGFGFAGAAAGRRGWRSRSVGGIEGACLRGYPLREWALALNNKATFPGDLPDRWNPLCRGKRPDADRLTVAPARPPRPARPSPPPRQRSTRR